MVGTLINWLTIMSNYLYLGFTPATFGHENIRNSLVTVEIPPEDHQTFRRHLDISMLVRTRQENGLVFYVGKIMTSSGMEYNVNFY